ncbi:MAG: SDR family oxidoreductase [Rhizobiales bacterium]|nr:SDR family oxidoreductase [Hyphomicrobiales bacterium]
MATDLKDMVALVTGGTRGIGLAIAEALAARGAKLVINGRTADAEVEAALANLRKNTEVEFVAGDAADPAVAKELVEATAKRFGRLDFLVPAAGGAHNGRITDLTPAAWEDAFRIHVHAVFHIFRAAHDLLAKRGGSVLLIGSVAGVRGCPATVAYQTVKGALPQMARALARDHAVEDIRVNVVEPGIIRTRFHAAMTPEAERNNLDNRIPLKRFGTAENVATAAVELLTNPFITGETLVIDGGMSMRMV